MCQASLSQRRAVVSRRQTPVCCGRYYSSMQKTRPESETGPAYPIASVNNALLQANGAEVVDKLTDEYATEHNVQNEPLE